MLAISEKGKGSLGGKGIKKDRPEFVVVIMCIQMYTDVYTHLHPLLQKQMKKFRVGGNKRMFKYRHTLAFSTSVSML